MPRLLHFAFLLLIAVALAPLARAGQPDLLDPAVAFRLDARLAAPGMLEVRYLIAPGYYLYRDKLAFRSETPGVELGAPQLPAGQRKKDEFFGEVETYRGDLRIQVPVTAGGEQALTLVAQSQGCADAGVCYVPQEEKRVVQLAAMSGPAFAPSTATDVPGGFFDAARGSDDLSVARVFDHAPWIAVLTFFGFGLLLAFTPCVLPMVPILSGIIVGQGHRVTRGHAFLLSAAYVLGMSLTYAVAGVLAGLSGALLSAALQNAWVLGTFAAIFVILAGGMLGWYRVQLPQGAQTRLAAAMNALPGGQYAGVFVMGALSALIAGPCIAAPLAGALLYIGQSGNVALGGAALFAMAIGMGVPLLLVGVSAGALLPRAGVWMVLVQRFFGFVLLGTAIYFVSPLLSVSVEMGAWAVLLILLAVQLRVFDALPPTAGGLARFGKGVGVVVLAAGVVYLIGGLSGARDFREPLPFLRATATDAPHGAVFQRVNSVAELDAAIRAAGGRAVMLDFYADWCVSCKQMERDTFTDARVRERFGHMLLLQADVTANTADHGELLKRFKLFGPPGIVFFDREGHEIDGLRVVGFQGPADFSRVLDRALSR